jgi:hypothetical protein
VCFCNGMGGSTVWKRHWACESRTRAWPSVWSNQYYWCPHPMLTARHSLLEQTPLVQSFPSTHAAPSKHFLQALPPQSTPVSSPFLTSSTQVGCCLAHERGDDWRGAANYAVFKFDQGAKHAQLPSVGQSTTQGTHCKTLSAQANVALAVGCAHACQASGALVANWTATVYVRFLSV